jgi:hypothetical protein
MAYETVKVLIFASKMRSNSPTYVLTPEIFPGWYPGTTQNRKGSRGNGGKKRDDGNGKDGE